MNERGGYAFPRAEGETSFPENGMSLRDWFAGQALVGLCVSDKFVRIEGSDQAQAAWAYAIADAMLRAREEK